MVESWYSGTIKSLRFPRKHYGTLSQGYHNVPGFMPANFGIDLSLLSGPLSKCHFTRKNPRNQVTCVKKINYFPVGGWGLYNQEIVSFRSCARAVVLPGGIRSQHWLGVFSLSPSQVPDFPISFYSVLAGSFHFSPC